jgi:hypothetical protein
MRSSKLDEIVQAREGAVGDEERSLSGGMAAAASSARSRARRRKARGAKESRPTRVRRGPGNPRREAGAPRGRRRSASRSAQAGFTAPARGKGLPPSAIASGNEAILTEERESSSGAIAR